MKKILIITESNDITADKVCLWLHYFGQEFIRFNTDLEPVWVHEVKLEGSAVTLQLGHYTGLYLISDFDVIWFRRGLLVNQHAPVPESCFPEDSFIRKQIDEHLHRELYILNEFVYLQIPVSTKQINNPLKYNINKLQCLWEAARHGLNTPETFVFRSKKNIRRVPYPLITKNIGDVLIAHSDQYFLTQTTLAVTAEEMQKVNDLFFPSLFQKALKKIADIRVFFFLGKTFATAVYSNAPQTDFRASDHMSIGPFSFPEKETERLLKLADTIGLESGSADFVLTTEDQLYFLEINPVGQIDFVSQLANLYIEKEIAQILIDHANN